MVGSTGEKTRTTSLRLPRPRPASPEESFLEQIPPSYSAELAERARFSGLCIGVVALIAMPAWNLFDRVLEPAHATTFMWLRIVGDVPLFACLWLLWRRPWGRAHAGLLSYLMLTIAQVQIAWMVVRASEARGFYLLGFSLALYGSGCLLVGRLAWTAAVVATTWVALGAAALTTEDSLPRDDVWAACFYLSTASVIALLAHAQRSRQSAREIQARQHLEQEQVHNSALLALLARQSNEDALTGLANRRRWDEELTYRCLMAAHDRTDLAVVLIDVDRFKEINDRLGHAGGDEALRQVGALLLQHVGARGLVARLGGDELGVLLVGTKAQGALALAEQLRHESQSLGLTLSLGVSSCGGNGCGPVDLMVAADEALYRAKRTRNTVARAPEPNDRRHRVRA